MSRAVAATGRPSVSFCQMAKSFQPAARTCSVKWACSAAGTAGIHSQARIFGFFVRKAENDWNSSRLISVACWQKPARLSNSVRTMVCRDSAISPVRLAASCANASSRSRASLRWLIQMAKKVITKPKADASTGSGWRIQRSESPSLRVRRCISTLPSTTRAASVSENSAGGSAARASIQFQSRASMSMPSTARTALGLSPG